MVLIARETPTPVSPVVVTLVLIASIVDVFWASIFKSPVVFILLLVIYALAWLKIRLVAMTPLSYLITQKPLIAFPYLWIKTGCKSFLMFQVLHL